MIIWISLALIVTFVGAIAMVTLFGKSASSKFSSVSKPIESPTTVFSNVSAAALKRELTTRANPMSQEAATCIVEGLLVAGVPLDQYYNPTPINSQKKTAVFTACVNKSAGITTTTR